MSSTVRSLGLAERCYGCLLDFFHSCAVDLDCLTRIVMAAPEPIGLGSQR